MFIKIKKKKKKIYINYIKKKKIIKNLHNKKI